jgi:CubicO group peptidase (beta-lactamase class C family)
MGAEADATWIVNPGGVEYAWGNFNASLRDWGRLAMLLADDGARDGKQIIPRDYLLEATDFKRHPPAFAPRAATPYYGYGYQFWTYPAESRRFALLGVFGQSIFVDPQLRLALIITAAQRDPVSIGDGYGAERNALWRSIVERYGTW